MIFKPISLRILIMGLLFFTGQALRAEDRVVVTEFVYGEC